MRKRVILLTLAIALASLSYIFVGKSDIKSLDDLIKSRVPVGATKQQVYDFLDSNSIRSSAYNAGPDPMVSLPDEKREWSRYVNAYIPKKSLSPWSPDYTIHIVFYFDESYKVIDHKLEKIDKPADSF